MQVRLAHLLLDCMRRLFCCYAVPLVTSPTQSPISQTVSDHIEAFVGSTFNDLSMVWTMHGYGNSFIDGKADTILTSCTSSCLQDGPIYVSIKQYFLAYSISASIKVKCLPLNIVFRLSSAWTNPLKTKRLFGLSLHHCLVLYFIFECDNKPFLITLCLLTFLVCLALTAIAS